MSIMAVTAKRLLVLMRMGFSFKLQQQGDALDYKNLVTSRKFVFGTISLRKNRTIPPLA
jgi:hypothetical protein